MKKSISKDLEELAKVVESHHLKLGLDQEKAMQETRNLVEKIGNRFNGDRLYISHNLNQKIKSDTVRKYLIKNYSIREISKITGISRSSVLRIIKKIKNKK